MYVKLCGRGSAERYRMLRCVERTINKDPELPIGQRHCLLWGSSEGLPTIAVYRTKTAWVAVAERGEP